MCKQSSTTRLLCVNRTPLCDSTVQLQRSDAVLVRKQQSTMRILYADNIVQRNSCMPRKQSHAILLCNPESLIRLWCANKTVLWNSCVQTKQSYAILVCNQKSPIVLDNSFVQYYAVMCKQNSTTRLLCANRTTLSDSTMQLK